LILLLALRVQIFMIMKTHTIVLIFLSQALWIATASAQFACNCLLPPDSTYSVVPFDGSGGSGGPGVPPEYRNDDWSSAAIMLPFSFCMYGNTYDSIFINNNGNISFDNPYSTFTGTAFPSAVYSMIAPFWADADTRDPGSGIVYYKLNPTSLIIIWDGIGYFNTHSNLLNRFQLIITNGTDPLVPQGNVSFCYGDMQWTTGDASGGLNGFGGTPAVAGINVGNGINYVQFGLFDAAGTHYDGPGSGIDGVSWLDNAHFIINACADNVPPVSLNCMNDTITLYTGDTVLLDFQFLAPEIGQTVSVNLQHAMNNFSTLSTAGTDYVTVSTQLIADAANLGYNTLTVTATDNGSPAASTSYSRVVQILPFTGIYEAGSEYIAVAPNPILDQAVITTSLRGKCLFTLVDPAGRIIRSGEYEAKRIEMNRDGLSEGFYLFVITADDGRRFSGKLTVQ
jgi:hypothetical protein